MTNKTIEILETAIEYDNRNMRYFEMHCNATDEDMKQIYWTRSEEMSGICDGLIFAYNILTDKQINLTTLRSELESLKS